MNRLQQIYSLRLGLTGGSTAFVAYLTNTSYFGWMWMAITAFIITNTYAGATINAGLSRAVGTSAGAILGIVLSMIFTVQNLISIVMVFGLIGSISALAYHNNKNLRLMAMTASVVYILNLQLQSADTLIYVWQIGLERVANVVAAVLLTLLIDAMVTPALSSSQLQNQYQKLFLLFADSMTCLSMAEVGDQQIKSALLAQLGKVDNPVLLNEIYYEDKFWGNNHSRLLQQHQQWLSISYLIKMLLAPHYHYQTSLWSALLPEYREVLSALQNNFKTMSAMSIKQLQADKAMQFPITDPLTKLYQKLTELRERHYLKSCTPDEIREVYFALSCLSNINEELGEWHV